MPSRGGTSLSKGWKLIDRFSEDIDIVIDREVLGFRGENAPEAAPSRKQEKKRLDAIRDASRKYISETIEPELRASILLELPDQSGWSLSEDHTDPDGQTLVFFYPSVLSPTAGYISRTVKIEMGARSDTEPAEKVAIESYITEIFPGVFSSPSFTVRAVSPVRTFWEKAMLLHEESFRPTGKTRRKQYLSRHYYDLYRLVTAGVGRKAADDLELLWRVVNHRKIYFRYTWVDYDAIVPGRLSLVPSEEKLPQWNTDYENMRREMFYGEVPTFNEIIEVLRRFQDEFNQRQGMK